MAQPSAHPKRDVPRFGETFRLLSAARTLRSLTAWVVLLGGGIGGGIAGCANDHYYLHRPQSDAPSDAVLPWVSAAPRTLAMFEGDTGRIATWFDLMQGVTWADVVLIGETHDDLAAHQFEAALVEDALASAPGAVVSMEMFERNHQAVLGDYLASRIDVAALIERAKTRRWEFKSDPALVWEITYQPIVDAAKARGTLVIAANAPREYTRIARNDGYDALRALPVEEQVLFSIPAHLDQGDYRKRFNDVMAGNSGTENPSPNEYDAIFRSQQLWDATMAASIAKALDDGATKVLHVVGGFHVEWRGGIFGQLRDLKPFAKILVVTVIRDDATALPDGDRGRADIVAYSGKRQPPRDAAPEGPTATTAEAGSPVEVPGETAQPN